MTIVIADNSPRKTYTATAGQTNFPTDFAFFSKPDVNVYVDDVLKTLDSDYSIPTTGPSAWTSGNDGTIVFSPGLSAGQVVVLTRDVELERTTDFPTSGPFQVSSLNVELDKLIAMMADMKDLADRGLRLSDSDTSAALVLANKDDRKGTVLAFNETTGAVEIGPTIADTNSIAQIKADIATLADIQDGTVATNAITTVSSISSDVTTVSSNNANVTTVAGQTTNMQNITDNLTAVQNAATNATNAAASATAAATSETNAATSETNAATSATNASTSATAASTSATAAASSATAAASSATAAATSETNAGTSETNAATSATSAGTSETNAASSATSAASSATSAASAQTAAESARDSALAAYDNFDDRYLGVKSSDPTVDNDGDALVAGALYFNSTSEKFLVYTGSAWADAYADGTTLVSKSGDTMTGNLSFGDNNKAIFGAGSDLQIFHDGTYNFINAASGQFIFMQADELRLRSSTGETYFASTLNAATGLYYDASLKLSTTSTGINVTGTVTADGLTVDGTINAYRAGFTQGVQLLGDSGGNQIIGTATNDKKLIIKNQAATQGIEIVVSNKAMDIANNGDISFYEDTGTTAKLFWDASAESLGIGTTSPDAPIRIDYDAVGTAFKVTGGNGGQKLAEFIRDIGADASIDIHASGGDPAITFTSTGNTFSAGVNGGFFEIADNNALGTNTRFVISGTGLVGIGTSSPAGALHIVNSGLATQLRVSNTTADATTKYGTVLGSHYTNSEEPITGMLLTSSSSATGGSVSIGGGISSANAVNNILFYTAANNTTLTGTERMRISSAGDVLISTTSNIVANSSTSSGTSIGSGLLESARAGVVAQFNRQNSDGSVIDIQRSGTTVGSIGVNNANNTFIGSTTTAHTGLEFGNDILPRKGSNTADNQTNLGSSSIRFKDLHLSGTAHTGLNIHLQDSGITRGKIELNASDTDDLDIKAVSLGSNMKFFTVDTERARLDASGNLLVGKTTNTLATAGISLRGDVDVIQATRSGGSGLNVNRLASDGPLIRLYKDTVEVGSIGSAIGNAYFAGSSTGITFGSANVYPTNASGTKSNGTLTLGSSSNRFDDLHLSGTANAVTINTDGPTGTGNGIVMAASGWPYKGRIGMNGTSGGKQYWTANYNLNTSSVDSASYYSTYIENSAQNGIIAFGTSSAVNTAPSERARLDASGNLLVGTTSADTTGSQLRANGQVRGNSSAIPVFANRIGSGGVNIRLQNNSTTAGGIGTHASTTFIYGTGGGVTDTGLIFADSQIVPCNGSGVGQDDVFDLGTGTSRFDDVFATNGTINTSDGDEKQDIEELTEAEHRVAVAVKGLLRKFRWKSRVEEKGDDARIHFGIIAQDLQAAFEAEGLDAGRYAMFINSTWTDEETGEERSRMGVRYNELLAFIIAAI